VIVRSKRNTNFTIISNVGLEDGRLSLKAKGMLAYLLSKPDNWQVSERHLATIGPDGRDAVSSALAELEKYNYLKRETIRDKAGRFQHVSAVSDEPWLENPALDKPASDKSASENPSLISTEVVRTEVVSTERTRTEQREAQAPQPATHPAILVFDELHFARPPKRLLPIIEDAGIVDLDLWRVAVRTWIGHSYNPTDVIGMLDFYEHPEKMERGGKGKPAGAVTFAQQGLDAGEMFRSEMRKARENGNRGCGNGVLEPTVRLLPEVAANHTNVQELRKRAGGYSA